MKKVLIFSLNLVLALALLAILPAAAQGPQPPTPMPSHPSQTQTNLNDEKEHPLPGTVAAPAGDINAQSIQMGAPGTSFRYLKTFGKTDQPYPADGRHLNTPDGLFINGTDLYVTEEHGDRVLKFDLTSSANPLTASLILGHAGISWSHDDFLGGAKDVTVDAGGNIWVVISTAIKKFDASGALVLSIPATNPWETGTDANHFNNPTGLALGPGGYLYVADTDNSRIQVYDIGGSTPVYITSIGETGISHADNNGFNTPRQIIFDSANRMYVLDAGNYRVQRCVSADPWINWTCTTAFGESGVEGTDLTHLRWAGGLAISNHGGSDELYITDSNNNGRILKCDISVDPITCQIYVDATIVGADFNWAADAAVDADGKIYISDYHNHRIQVFEDTGAGAVYQDTIGISHQPYVVNPNYINSPWGIAVATDGSMFVTENNGYRLVKLNAAGVQLWHIGEAGVWGDDNSHFSSYWAGLEGNPAIDASGRIYVPDTGNSRVQIFNPNGSYFATLGNGSTDKYQFSCPNGVAIHPTNGSIYVSDVCKQRVQVFTPARVYKATIGLTDSSGRDNYRFNGPRGLTVDKNGNVFVADSDNNRVQKCAPSGSGYKCVTFAGNEDNASSGFGTMHPLSIAVDAGGRVYAADEWNNRVQVFDASGAYISTIGGNWGTMNGDMVSPRGVALDASGNVYVTEGDNHRIQKYAPGTAGWKQVNINGFGMEGNDGIYALATFGNYLYAGTSAGQLWRSSDGSTWQPVLANGFNSSGNYIDHLFVYGTLLYASTGNDQGGGGQLWRTANGLDWEPVRPVGSMGGSNPEIFHMARYGNNLYFSTWVYDLSHGAELWRSPNGNDNSWILIDGNGFGDLNNETILDFRSYNSNFYASTINKTSGVQIWRSTNGNPGSWGKVNTNGFGDTGNTGAALADFGGYLYAVTSHMPGAAAQIWRCKVCNGSDWTKLTAPFAANSKVRTMPGLLITNNTMYLTLGETYNENYGLKVYSTANGTTWTEIATDGFGNKNNVSSYFNNALAAFNQQLYVGTYNYTNGGQIWRATAANLSKTVTSIAAQDGWILELKETSNTGGSMNSSTTTFQLGDDAAKRQYRAILSFDTSSIPDQAVINSVTLRIKQSGLPVGTNPFNALGGLLVDIRKGVFGTNSLLALPDFSVAASATKVGTFGKVPAAGWYSVSLNATGKANLNKLGLTQFRLYFTTDDNNNAVADYMKFLSGNSATDKPALIINYTLP